MLKSKKLLNSLRFFPWYLVLASLAFVLHGYASYPFVSQWVIFLAMFAEYVLVAFLAAVLIFAVTKSWPGATFVALLLLCVNFYGGELLNVCMAYFGPNHMLARQIFWIPVWATLVLALTIQIRKGRVVSRRLLKFANLMFLMWVAVESFYIFRYQLSEKKLNEKKLVLQMGNQKQAGELPDIFIVVLDEYAGTNVLNQIGGFNNNDFVESLRAEGFFVADSSYSNYNYTPYSVASFLQLNYLFDTGATMPHVADYPFVFEKLSENAAFSTARHMGYEVEAFSWFPTNADWSFSSRPLSKRIRSFVDAQTMLQRNWTSNLSNNASYWDVLGIAEANLMQFDSYNFDILQSLLKLSSEKRVRPVLRFSHLMMPHFPFYRNQESVAYSIDSLKKIDRNSSEHYIAYLQHTNQEVLKLVRAVRMNSERPCSLLIVSDHGYRAWSSGEVGHSLYNNFFAWKSSDGNYTNVKNPVSLVNALRYVFNHEWGGELEYLPHRIQPISY